MKFFFNTLYAMFFLLSVRTAEAVDMIGDTGNGGGGSIGLQNPLKSPTLMGFLEELLAVIMVFAIPLIVFMIIYAGFMYVTAQGEPGKIKTAHNALLYAVIGGVIILGANVILAVISGTVDAFR
jgi:hypothetical protein